MIKVLDRTFWLADVIHKSLQRDRVLRQPRAGSSLTRITMAACAAVRLELFLSVLDVARRRSFRPPRLLLSLPFEYWNSEAQQCCQNSRHKHKYAVHPEPPFTLVV